MIQDSEQDIDGIIREMMEKAGEGASLEADSKEISGRTVRYFKVHPAAAPGQHR